MDAKVQPLSNEALNRLHDASMEILKEVGVAFHDLEAVGIFRRHGVKVDGKAVFLNEEQVTKALDTAPSHFTVTARNPKKTVRIGGKDSVLVPAYGAPFMASLNGEQRKATMGDYDNFCRLVQTSPYLNMNGFMMVEPCDVPSETAHLDMMFSNIVLCDKPFMGSGLSRQAAVDAIEMAAIVWGGKERIRMQPVMIPLITPITPLQYPQEMAGALIEFARWGQPVLVADLIMAGSSGPMTLAGLLALQGAEILAGITLAQLITPGTPVVYGGILCPTDMRSGVLSIGAPEVSMLIPATAQLAKFYGLPSRGGGALTDAHVADMQAGIESALALATAVRCGINFILHACGILGAFIAMSYEKFIADEEVCGMLLKSLEPIDISDEAIDLATIKQVGIGGEYLTHPKTLDRCRTEFFLPDLMNRKDYIGWKASGGNRLDEVATVRVTERLTAYEKPEIDRETEKALSDYVAGRKREH
jgi:trimethylamine--corrinoid protein Co-methyltransferase